MTLHTTIIQMLGNTKMVIELLVPNYSAKLQSLSNDTSIGEWHCVFRLHVRDPRDLITKMDVLVCREHYQLVLTASRLQQSASLGYCGGMADTYITWVAKIQARTYNVCVYPGSPIITCAAYGKVDMLRIWVTSCGPYSFIRKKQYWLITYSMLLFNWHVCKYFICIGRSYLSLSPTCLIVDICPTNKNAIKPRLSMCNTWYVLQ